MRQSKNGSGKGWAASDQQAARWFAAVDRGVMTLEERAAYEHWLSQAANRAAIARLEKIWARLDIAQDLFSTATGRTQTIGGGLQSRFAMIAAMLVAAAVSLPALMLTNGSWWTTLDWWSR